MIKRMKMKKIMITILMTAGLFGAEHQVQGSPSHNAPFTQCVNGVCTTYYPAVIEAERLHAEQQRLELEKKKFELEHPQPRELTKKEKDAIKREEHKAKVEEANRKANEANERNYKMMLERNRELRGE